MIDKLAFSLGHNDEIPNIELAILLCETEDKKGIEEVVNGLNSKNKAISNDCIKVLYEIGERKPELISDYAEEFIGLLHSKNNRLAWGSMTALVFVSKVNAKSVFEHLEDVKLAYKNGSVITIDNSISVFANLCNANKKYMETVFPIIIEHLSKCRPKEIPQHSERTMICVNNENCQEFIKVLSERKSELSSSQTTRVNKVIKMVTKSGNNK